MKTLFTVKCEDGGIVDPDLPLLYQWYYRTNRTMNWKSITYPSEGWTFFVHEFCLSARNVSAVDFDNFYFGVSHEKTVKFIFFYIFFYAELS